MIEGSGSASIPLTSGSGSGRPENMLIRWIRNIAGNDHKTRLMRKRLKRDKFKRYKHNFSNFKKSFS
jgi:hypothetical protein